MTPSALEMNQGSMVFVQKPLNPSGPVQSFSVQSVSVIHSASPEASLFTCLTMLPLFAASLCEVGARMLLGVAGILGAGGARRGGAEGDGEPSPRTPGTLQRFRRVRLD